MASAISAEVPIPQPQPDNQPKLSMAWGTKHTHDYALTVSLDDVMNEEMNMTSAPDAGTGLAIGGSDAIADTDTTSDEMLARLLQCEFDEEMTTSSSDAKAQTEAGGRKSEAVDVGFDPFRQPKTGDDSDDDDTREWDTFAAGTKFTVGKQGFAKSKGPTSKVLSTKHDAAVCGRRNACRVMVSMLCGRKERLECLWSP